MTGSYGGIGASNSAAIREWQPRAPHYLLRKHWSRDIYGHSLVITHDSIVVEMDRVVGSSDVINNGDSSQIGYITCIFVCNRVYFQLSPSESSQIE